MRWCSWFGGFDFRAQNFEHFQYKVDFPSFRVDFPLKSPKSHRKKLSGESKTSESHRSMSSWIYLILAHNLLLDLLRSEFSYMRARTVSQWHDIRPDSTYNKERASQISYTHKDTNKHTCPPLQLRGILRAPNPRGARGTKVKSPWGSGVNLGPPKIPAGTVSQKVLPVLA